MKPKVKRRKYAAKLFFQFRAVKDNVSNKRRVCEERIIVIETDNPQKALKISKKRGVKEEFSYTDKDRNNDVFFEFIGVKELIELGVSLDQDEVWWELYEKERPMERRDKLIPPEDELDAFKTSIRRRKGGSVLQGV